MQLELTVVSALLPRPYARHQPTELTHLGEGRELSTTHQEPRVSLGSREVGAQGRRGTTTYRQYLAVEDLALSQRGAGPWHMRDANAQQAESLRV